ncbi:hypothetical protein CLAFUR0_14518 [Fulvia fulva]|nr:hypothetical protein CLAFUR0_14518 [Fulvia fulva]
MEDVIHRYEEVAESVNQREFKRFVEEIRQKWHPLPPVEEFWEPGYRGEGWTEDGAFARCVYAEATGFAPDIQREEPLCEAEKKNQVLFRPLDSLLNDIIRGPLYDPKPEDKISKALSALLSGLQRQATDTASSEPISLELPRDSQKLLRITDGIQGAGLPSETANTDLVSGIDGLEQGLRHSFNNMWSDDWTVFTSWELGCCTQHRQIHYVLCRDARNDAVPIAWKVFDNTADHLDVYDSLAQFLEHQTVHIEQTPGGHKQELALYSDTYPTYAWYDSYL